MQQTASTATAGSALKVAIGGLLCLATALGIGRFVYTPILPVMAAALSMSKSQAGLIASANFLGYLVGALVASSPRLGAAPRPWLMLGLVVNALCLLAMALTADIGMFMAIRFLAGWASGFVMVFGSALVIERLRSMGRPALASLYFAGPGTGISASAALVAVLVAIGFDWSRLWLASAAVAVVAFGVIAWALPADAARPAPGASEPGQQTAAAGRPFLLLVIAYGLVGFGYVITSTFIVTLVRETPGVTWLEPWIWIIVGVSAIPSAAVWSLWATRFGALSAFAAAALAEAIGVAASALWPTAAGLVLAAVLLGATFVALTALGLVAVRSLMRGDPRRGIGIMTAAFGVGQIVGPALAGLTHDLTGTFALASLAAAAALTLSAVLAVMAQRPDAAGA